MALVFAVFILALLVVFLRPEGRASRIARLKAVATRAAGVIRTVLNRGTETVDRIAADLAEDRRAGGGVSQLLTPAEGAGTDPLEQSAKS
jgi:hypothetical protein